MTRIVWTDPAVSDLDSIHAYIARDAQIYADAVMLEIFEAVERLMHFPLSGRVVPELLDVDTREIMAGNYRVIYEAKEDVVSILTVLHGARQFPLL